MYGMPDGNPLAEVVSQLCQTHSRRHITAEGELVEGQEPALLVMLERAVASDTSGAYGGGATRTGSPVDVKAMALLDTIKGTVARHWPGRGDATLQDTPLRTRLEEWTRQVAFTNDEAHLLEMCLWWRSQIRDMFEPPKDAPLRGICCPACSASHVEELDEEGMTIFNVSLVAHLSEEPVRAECRGCGQEWRGGELLDLRAAVSFA
jgi:hypothetical protein